VVASVCGCKRLVAARVPSTVLVARVSLLQSMHRQPRSATSKSRVYVLSWWSQSVVLPRLDLPLDSCLQLQYCRTWLTVHLEGVQSTEYDRKQTAGRHEGPESYGGRKRGLSAQLEVPLTCAVGAFVKLASR
jgi:hypothetical protein